MTALHIRFPSILPRIETHARFTFRDIRCAARRADCIAETIALAWKWFVVLDQRGKDAVAFVSTLAAFAAQGVRCGRRLAGMERTNDVMNGHGQQRHQFHVERLPDTPMSSLTEALADNTVTPPPDAAAFRVDFPRWLETLPKRDRRLAEELMVGERTSTTAHRFCMSPARVSQLRKELCEDWTRFHGERVEATVA